MAVNYAEKYSSIIDERFVASSYTDVATNQNYDFDGVNKVNVYSSKTVPLNDYDMSAQQNRYGTPVELGNDVQGLILTQDKSFTFTIDKRNYDDTMMANSAAVALKRQIDEQITPTVDKYRLGVLAANAGSCINQVPTSANAYSCFLNATAILTDCKAPVDDRIAFVTPEYYKSLKLDSTFTGKGDKAQELAKVGQVDEIDGTAIILMPVEYFPVGVNFIITHPSVLLAPVKLADYIQHETPQGINGWLIEGRIYYDAFVLRNKKNAIIVSKDKSAALGSLTVASAAGTASGDTKITVTETLGSGNEYRYKVMETAALPVLNESCVTGWLEWDGSDDITAATGKKIVIAEVNGTLNAKKAGSATVTAKA